MFSHFTQIVGVSSSTTCNVFGTFAANSFKSFASLALGSGQPSPCNFLPQHSLLSCLLIIKYPQLQKKSLFNPTVIYSGVGWGGSENWDCLLFFNIFIIIPSPLLNVAFKKKSNLSVTRMMCLEHFWKPDTPWGRAVPCWLESWWPLWGQIAHILALKFEFHSAEGLCGPRSPSVLGVTSQSLILCLTRWRGYKYNLIFS